MPVARLRFWIQVAFTLLCGWIGVELILFLRWAQSGGQALFVSRPPGVEGFLPISALMSLRYWVLTGVVHPVHPAGLFILVAILATGLLLKKGFCSWLCPIGALGDLLARLGRRLFRRAFGLPRWLDWPLRSLKYLLLLFFLWAILAMSERALGAFLDSPYNRVAEFKMAQFFARLTPVGLGILIGLAGLSVVIHGFWCRYLCPYGALLGVLSVMSPLKVTRRSDSCTGCKACTRACPARIQVHRAHRVCSDECTACYRCIAACPEKDTLGMGLVGTRTTLPGRVFGAMMVGVFMLVTGLAMFSGLWRNGIPLEEYRQRLQELDDPVYRHAQGRTVSP